MSKAPKRRRYQAACVIFLLFAYFFVYYHIRNQRNEFNQIAESNIITVRYSISTNVICKCSDRTNISVFSQKVLCSGVNFNLIPILEFPRSMPKYMITCHGAQANSKFAVEFYTNQNYIVRSISTGATATVSCEIIDQFVLDYIISLP